MVFPIRRLDPVGDGNLGFRGSALVDELEGEFRLVGADRGPFDLIGLGEIPVIAGFGISDLQGWGSSVADITAVWVERDLTSRHRDEESKC